MTNHSITTIPAELPIPADDATRTLTVVYPDDPAAAHISQAGNVYTILISGEQTEGRYCLIDMLVPDGGGPPPHLSRRCSHCLKASWNLPSVARRRHYVLRPR